jgi:hypothetical protein
MPIALVGHAPPVAYDLTGREFAFEMAWTR